jgi:hypothetical protein
MCACYIFSFPIHTTTTRVVFVTYSSSRSNVTVAMISVS